MTHILNKVLKDDNYGVSGKNANPSVFYKITDYSLIRPDPKEDSINYSVTIAAYMNSGGTMGTGNALDVKVQLSLANTGYIIFDSYIKDGVTWTGQGDSTPCGTVTLTGTISVADEGAQTVKFLAYRPSQSGDAISSSNPAPGKTIGSGEVVTSSYTMNFPEKVIPEPDPEPEDPITAIGNVNIGQSWVACEIRVCAIGEGYIGVGNSSEYYDEQDFHETVLDEYGVSYVDEPDRFYATREATPGYPLSGVIEDNLIAWKEECEKYGDGNAWALYMKSDNVKQWMDCEITSL